MKIALILLTTLSASYSFAVPAATDTTELTVNGVHCSGCTKTISKKVCADKVLSENFESCGVTLVSADKKIGKLTIKMKKDKVLDLAAVDKAVASAGKEYSLVQPTAAATTVAPTAKPETKK